MQWETQDTQQTYTCSNVIAELLCLSIKEALAAIATCLIYTLSMRILGLDFVVLFVNKRSQGRGVKGDLL